jgi:ribosomal protein S18 acetylase RimI-like enzyme
MTFFDKKGSPFEVNAYRTEDHSFLENMYDSFSPKAKFQGMPPLKKETRQGWIEKVLDSGENFLAWRDNRVIGHVVVIPDMRVGDGEFLIFVHQNDRNRGVGTQLTLTVLEHAKNLGLTKIWLMVGTYNFTAIRLYKKCGFEFYENPGGPERPMIVRF